MLLLKHGLCRRDVALLPRLPQQRLGLSRRVLLALRGVRRAEGRLGRGLGGTQRFPLFGWGLGSKLRRVAESGRQWESVGDSGSLLLGVFRASTHEQETLGVTGSNRK